MVFRTKQENKDPCVGCMGPRDKCGGRSFTDEQEERIIRAKLEEEDREWQHWLENHDPKPITTDPPMREHEL